MKLNFNYFLNINKNQKIVINLLIDLIIIFISFILSKEIINFNNSDINILYQFLFIFIFLNILLSIILKIYLSVKRYFSSHLILNILF